MKKTSLLFIYLIISFFVISCTKDSYKADVIIYGGTSAAVIAAVEVAQTGKKVIIVSPDIHLGGLSSGGLGFTDTGDKSTIGGLSREFGYTTTTQRHGSGKSSQNTATKDKAPWL